MGPPRNRSVNKRFLYGTEASTTKDGGNNNKKNQRKKKLSDMLGPHWSKEELEHFYEAYRKHGREWKKVAAVFRNRSAEMVEAVYSLNKAYLSLPEGTASVVGFIAMMTDYYSNMEDRDSEQERNDGVGPSRKPKKRMQRKVHETTSKGFRLHPEAVPTDYGCLSLLKKKRSAGSRPRVVGKRTPRFPVSHSHGNVKKGLKLRENDEDVAHSIAMTLAEASKRGGSPQISLTPNRRSDSLMSSPSQSTERMYDESDVASGWFIDDDNIEGSMEADNTELSRYKSKEKINAGYTLHAKKVSHGRKVRVDEKENTHLDYIWEVCSGTEGQNLGTIQINFKVEVADAKPSAYSQVSKKRDENSAFDALETLANLSLMISPEANENGKDEPVDDSRLRLNMPASRQREMRNRKQSISRSDAADDQTHASAKNLVNDTNAASEAKESNQLIFKVSRKRQKIGAFKISKAEASVDTTPRECEAKGAAQTSLNSHISQSSSSQLVKTGQHVSSSIHSRRELHVSEMKPPNICIKARNKRKMYKPKALEISKLSDVVVDKSSEHLLSLSKRIDKLEGELYNCLSNQLMRRWCAFEWFYSAIDEPWFAKREFVEYLYHVGLGHVPRLTRVEWGVIRSSLGKPRRFSDQFLKEEKDKLNQFRDSVRTHYTELRAGSRDGLPTDLARPLVVGQRVLAIYPKTREIHDGTVLTVDHDRCRVQFHHPELGAEVIMDTDCMPLNPFENLPASLMRRKPIEKFLESFSEFKVHGLGKDRRLEKLENMVEVASVKSEFQSRNGPRDTLSDHHVAYSVPGTLAKFQAKEADVEAIAELTRALDKKEAVVIELRRMNDDVLENQNVGDYALKDSDAFKKQYAAVLVQLNDVNAQVSSALFRLRQRNTYQQDHHLNLPKAIGDLSDHGAISDHTTNHIQDSHCQVNEIVEISRTKARAMVDIAMQALSSLKFNPTVEIDKAVDYMNDLLPLDDSYIPPVRSIPITSGPLHSSLSLHQKVSTVNTPDSNLMDPSDLNKASVPSELITQCVATLFIIQKCTERQFPPAEVASILDSAVSCLQPCSAQNLQVYAEIQKCMGIIKNQILALVPT